MPVIYINVRGSLGGGGPSIFAYNIAKELNRRGFKVIYNNPTNADVALCIIETGKILKQINRKKTKIILRLNGIYNAEYNKLFNRPIRPDMIALHEKLKHDIPLVDYAVYQSQFSRDRIEDEIVKRSSNWGIINNGVDVSLFKPINRISDGFINLMHVGKMRDKYLMESLIGTYKELKNRGKQVRLILAGSMDKQCLDVYNHNKHDQNIKYLGSFKNDKLNYIYSQGDIFLAPRQGSSNDHVVIEAQASGLPTIVSKWGGNGDSIIDKQTGIIVNNGGHWNYGTEYNIKIADAVEQIIPDLATYKKRAREHAVKNLNIKIMVDKYLKAMGV